MAIATRSFQLAKSFHNSVPIGSLAYRVSHGKLPGVGQTAFSPASAGGRPHPMRPGGGGGAWTEGGRRRRGLDRGRAAEAGPGPGAGGRGGAWIGGRRRWG